MSILLADEFFSAIKLSRFELPVLMLLASLGMMLMVSSNSFLSLYMGLELQSLALYVLAAFNRDNLRSTEAGLKYFVLGALSSGMMLYGISLIYGFTGTTSNSHAIATVVARPAHLLGVMLRHRLPDRGPGLQGLRRAASICGRPTSTKARPPRSPPISPPPPRWRRCACSCAPS